MSDEMGIALEIAGRTTAVLAIIILRPWLHRYALSRPNSRSSHREPTPRRWHCRHRRHDRSNMRGVYFLAPGAAPTAQLYAIFADVVLMACVGAVDDIRPVAVVPRFLLQAVIVASVIYMLPDSSDPCLWWRLMVRQSGYFMDGPDWMTVAEIVLMTATLATIGAPRGHLGVPLSVRCPPKRDSNASR
jgi:hypothetical protein